MLGATCEGDQLERSCFEPQTLSGVLEVFCGADHAGDLGTRKSLSGMAVMWESHLIKRGREVQSTTAWSSGESEYARCSDLQPMHLE